MNRKLKGRIVERYGSQFEFARIIGAHEAVVSRVVRGHVALDDASKHRWAIALGVEDLGRLFEGRNDEQK